MHVESLQAALFFVFFVVWAYVGQIVVGDQPSKPAEHTSAVIK